MIFNIFILSSVFFITVAIRDLCELDLNAGMCLFGGETVLMPYAVPSNLVGYWTFDDNYGLDYSGSKNHALSPPTPAPSKGGIGYSASFTGSNYLEVPNSDSFGSKIYSMSFWLYVQKVSLDSGIRWCPIIQKGVDTASNNTYQRSPAIYYDRQDKFLKVYVSTRLTAKYPQGEYVISNARIPYYRWHHIAVVRTQSRIRLYVNGIIDAVNSTSGVTVTNSNSLFVGNTPWTLQDCPLYIYIDELRFYDNRELAEEEVEAESYGALGAIEPYYIRLGCINCDYDLASTSCTKLYHLCTSIELHSGGYAVARAMGWTDWNSHIWSTASTSDQSNSSGLGLCCLNLD
jgi:Concanavalin A-like lectin/glucanases superfamily